MYNFKCKLRKEGNPSQTHSMEHYRFRTKDPYKDIAAVVPYAINWQVKESVFGLLSEVRNDFKRIAKIIYEGGYKG